MPEHHRDARALSEHDNFIHDKHGYCYYSLEPNKIPWIYNLYVEPQYRREGHARRLLNYVINVIHGTGYTGVIHVQAKPQEHSIELDALVRFYTDMGLSVTTLDPDEHLVKEHT